MNGCLQWIFSHLETMLSDYKCLFKHNNFNHFCTFATGLINTPYRGTMTQVYQSGTKSASYWTLPKYLSRGKWCADKVAAVLTCQVQSVFNKGVEGFRLDNDVLAICPNAAATPLLSLDKYNRFTKNC